MIKIRWLVLCLDASTTPDGTEDLLGVYEDVRVSSMPATIALPGEISFYFTDPPYTQIEFEVQDSKLNVCFAEPMHPFRDADPDSRLFRVPFRLFPVRVTSAGTHILNVLTQGIFLYQIDFQVVELRQ